jgi:hypothetical protein
MKLLPTLPVLLLSCFSAALSAADWRPVERADLELKTPRIEPGADAEAIFWDVKIEDQLKGRDLSLTLSHYIRIKIFSDLGREKFSSVEIPLSGKRTVHDIAGRTIKADGTIIELKKDGIFDQDLVKTKGTKLRGRTFTLPNVAAGDIIEYRYKETRENEIVDHMRLDFQRDLPIWSVTYHLKPLQIPYLPYGMRTMALQCKPPAFEQEPNGFYSTTMTNMPAFREEPNMPPESQLRAWLLVYYEEDKKTDAEKYWKEIGKKDFSTFKPLLHADGLVKQTAEELVSGIAKPEDKLAAIDTFCRTKIRNLNSSAFHLTADERKEVKENKSPGDTLKQKAGSGMDVDLLFGALVNAAGFEARMARVADRGHTFFSPARPSTYFLGGFDVAVKLDDKWTFFDPATPYLDHGMIRWQEEGGQALVSDPKAGFFVPTQYSEPERSVRQRRAKFKLLDDGTLEGTVQYSYTGHVGRDQKSRYEEMTPAQQEEEWKKSLQARLSTAELSDFAMKDTGDAGKSLVVEHKVTVPGYAIRTGKRLLLQPAFFERNLDPRFTDSKRKWDVYFDYGWAEDDDLSIELPQGWVLDDPVAPRNSKIGDIGIYTADVRKSKDGRVLFYKRRFDWGYHAPTVIPAEHYSQVKKVFEFIQEQDNYTIALKAAGDGK